MHELGQRRRKWNNIGNGMLRIHSILQFRPPAKFIWILVKIFAVRVQLVGLGMIIFCRLCLKLIVSMIKSHGKVI